jgi:hypothetical protein
MTPNKSVADAPMRERSFATYAVARAQLGKLAAPISVASFACDGRRACELALAAFQAHEPYLENPSPRSSIFPGKLK